MDSDDRRVEALGRDVEALRGQVEALRTDIERLDLAVRRGGWKGRLRRVLIRLGILALIALALWFWRVPLLTAYAHRFRVDNPAPSDVLVVLLGNLDHRPAHAAELYRRGLAPRVVLCTSEASLDHDVLLSERTRRLLVDFGVPDSHITVLDGPPVTSTFDEARRVRAYLAEHPAQRITLVTTAFHTARSRWVFRRVFAGMAPAVDIRVAAARDRRFREDTWFRREEGLIAYFDETIKWAYYLLKY